MAGCLRETTAWTSSRTRGWGSRNHNGYTEAWLKTTAVTAVLSIIHEVQWRHCPHTLPFWRYN